MDLLKNITDQTKYFFLFVWLHKFSHRPSRRDNEISSKSAICFLLCRFSSLIPSSLIPSSDSHLFLGQINVDNMSVNQVIVNDIHLKPELVTGDGKKWIIDSISSLATTANCTFYSLIAVPLDFNIPFLGLGIFTYFIYTEQVIFYWHFLYLLVSQTFTPFLKLPLSRSLPRSPYQSIYPIVYIVSYLLLNVTTFL